MASKYYPYTRERAIEIYSRYYGTTKNEARKQIKNVTPSMIYEMENGLIMEAKKSFYND